MNAKSFLSLLAGSLLLVGCIQDEPLSPYADIEAFALPEAVTLSSATFNQTYISIQVKKGANISALVPAITISEGATISPEPSVPQDFSKKVVYTVTSADGANQRVYTVQTISTTVYKYDFENWEALNPNYVYETPFEYNKEGKKTTPWDSSNPGIAIYKASEYTTPAHYPVHKTTDATSGKYAVEMKTIKGPGNVLNIINVPIASGSLFFGVLNPLNALRDPALATRFGMPFRDKPARFTGTYKYRAGTEVYLDPQGKPLPNMKDSCAVYAVFYKADNDDMMLDGTNVLTHPNIISLAMLPPDMRAASPGNDFVTFDLPFEKKSDAVVDFDKYKYKIAIVLSSSFYGYRYEGSIGSHLIVDDLELIIEE